MKKKSLTLAVAATLAASMTFSSCIGSFGLTNKLLSWNQSINSKFVNELVFIAFHIIPVYEITILSDILVLNSIEFWSGNSPVADAGKTQNVKLKTESTPLKRRLMAITLKKQEKKTRLLTWFITARKKAGALNQTEKCTNC